MMMNRITAAVSVRVAALWMVSAVVVVMVVVV